MCARLRDEMSEPEQPPKSGVDTTLVAWMLAKTPAERLATLERFAAEIKLLSNARKLPREPKEPDRP